MDAEFHFAMFISLEEDKFFSMKIRFENSNILADFDKIDKFEGSKVLKIRISKIYAWNLYITSVSLSKTEAYMRKFSNFQKVRFYL